MQEKVRYEDLLDLFLINIMRYSGAFHETHKSFEYG